MFFFLGANILLDKSDNCKLADFGASRQIQVRFAFSGFFLRVEIFDFLFILYNVRAYFTTHKKLRELSYRS